MRKYPKDAYPEMVSGYGDGERGYKFATISIIDSRNEPIILGIEPVRENSQWEADGESVPLATMVDRLLEQAEQHVSINKVFADREFDTHDVRDVIDSRGLKYVIPKRKYQKDWAGIDRVKEHDDADVAVESTELTVDDRTHDVSILYVPSREEQGSYAVFTVNDDVPPERARGVTSQYSRRWIIENQFHRMKDSFIPTTSSKDYRIRFTSFLLGGVLFNTWRLANELLRPDKDNIDRDEDDADEDGGADPLVSTGAFITVFSCHLEPD